MPIYAYRCSNCGHAQDVLQRMSDPVLSVCPACGQSTYVKQVTAAGFQLKGSGWYVTDFRGDKKAAPAADADKPAAKEGDAAASSTNGAEGAAAGGDAGSKSGDAAKKPDAAASTAAAPSPAPAAAPAAPAAGKPAATGKPAD
jgi:putative FmdB family regulatory protein